MKFELMEHQREAIRNLGSGKVLYGGVGSGKSATVLGYYVENEEYRPIIVITTAKKRDSLDWESEAAKFGIGTELSLYGTITIDSWNNIGKYEAVEDAFFIFDEQRVVGHGAWVKSFIKIARKNHWVLLSATPGDTWMDYVPVFLANGYYKNVTEFRRKHVVFEPFLNYPKVKEYLNVPKLELMRNEVLVEMPYIKPTKRILNWMPVGHDQELWDLVQKKRWNPWTDEPIKDAAELFRCMRRVSNTHPSRLETIRELQKIHPRLVIFYNFDYELEILRGLVDQAPTYEWNGHVKNDNRAFEDEPQWFYLVQYVAGAEAWNCTKTDAMVLYSLTYSYKNFEQAQGRIDRLDTDFVDLYYYILVSNLKIDRLIKGAIGTKRNFNERKAMKEMVQIGQPAADDAPQKLDYLEEKYREDKVWDPEVCEI